MVVSHDGKPQKRPAQRRKPKVRHTTTFEHRQKLSRDAIGQFMSSYRDDLNAAIASLKVRLEGVLEVIVKHGKKRIDISLGRWTDKCHGHIVVIKGGSPRAVRRIPYGYRYQ